MQTLAFRSRRITSSPTLLLPSAAIVVLGECNAKIDALLDGWLDALPHAPNQERHTDLDVVAGADAAFLFLADQSLETIYQMDRLLSEVAGLDIPIIVAATGERLAPEARELTRNFTLAFTSDTLSGLLHPLRMMLSSERVVGYDNADLLDLWQGRIGHVHRLTFGSKELLSAGVWKEFAQAAGCTLLMLSRAPHQHIQDIDELGSRVRSAFPDLSAIAALNNTGEPDEIAEVLVLQDRRPR